MFVRLVIKQQTGGKCTSGCALWRLWVGGLGAAAETAKGQQQASQNICACAPRHASVQGDGRILCIRVFVAQIARERRAAACRCSAAAAALPPPTAKKHVAHRRSTWTGAALVHLASHN